MWGFADLLDRVGGKTPTFTAQTSLLKTSAV
jgi:hypothetical protein